MNEFHAFVKAFTDVHTYGRQTSASVCVYIFVCRFHTIYFIGIHIFNNGRRKFSKIPFDSA